MSERLQSGIHPDADQLNAFVEHALPPQEREQTLAHLAECAACRSIVSLSLPPVDEAPRPQPAPARRPWFLGWNLAWPVAAALAALVPLIMYVHRTETTRGTAPPTEMAKSQPPAPPLAPPGSAPPPAANTPSSGAAKEKSASPPAAPKSALGGRSPGGIPKPRPRLDTTDATLGGTIENELYSELPLSMNGIPRDSKAFQYLTPGVQDNPASKARQGASNGNSGIYGGTGQTNLNENFIEGIPVASVTAPAPPAAAPAAAAASAVDQTVTATDAPPMLDAGGAAFGALALRKSAPEAPLPSGQPVLSTAASGRLALALDTSNTLFVSDDGGRRWRPVPAQWKGRAVRVALANPTAAQLHGAARGAGTGFAMGAIAAPPAAGAPSPNSSVAGTVTDPTGAVIRDASVVITDAARQVLRTARTDTAGHYRIDSLAPDSYQLEARAPGFQTLELPVTVAAAQPSLANLTLQVGAATETVTVTDAPMMIENKDAAPPKTAAAPPAPLFEITTESGDRWTSPDGQTWTRRP